ncbi:hypothetical protein CASFOL_008316 [Castilleja foliolosa]|uniref:Uncharacterized protein n=1 Tax=Castilleja foliolosa TaxID=1961234 RepID=A0ABD3DYN0_9LAMI
MDPEDGLFSISRPKTVNYNIVSSHNSLNKHRSSLPLVILDFDSFF